MNWRRVGRLPGPRTWVLWAITIYITIVVASTMGDVGMLAFPLGFLGAVLLIVGAQASVRFVLAPAVSKFSSTVETPPPPTRAQPDSHYETPPPIQYPPFAHARRQSGWVQLALQVAPDGRIRCYRILDQAPGRVFERAAVSALAGARLPHGEQTREMDSVIVFVVPSETAPAWVRQRLDAAR